MKFKRDKNLPYPQPWEFVLELIGNKLNGIFIDVGAYDGITYSNSLYFESELNWTGVCIEPNPVAFKKLKENRKSININAGISNIEQILPFYRVSGYAEMLSGFKDFLHKDHIDRIYNDIQNHGGKMDVIDVKSMKLSNVIKENNLFDIDYLSIDVEGNELNVLKSIDFDKCNIHYISAENISNEDTEVKEFLFSKGYEFVKNVCSDDIYRKKYENR